MQVAQPILNRPLDRNLDLLQLPTIRRVTISLPPQLTQRLDLQCEKLRVSRSHFSRAAIQGLLDQVENLRVRGEELEPSK
jgi:predicted DNA-binding protein